MNIQALLTFYLINSRGQFSDRNINEEIANSLFYVIEKFFVPRGGSFIFVMSFEREETKTFYQDLSAILFGSYDNIKTQIVVNNGISVRTGLYDARMRAYNILVVDSLKSFLNIDLANKVKNYDINEFYHIFLHNKDSSLEADIKGILSYCWANYIINVNVEVQTAKGDLIVYTYFPFTESHCNKVIPVEVNRFKNGAMVNADLFPQKLQNMHKCLIKVATWHTPPYLGLDNTKSGGIEKISSGFEGQLLKELSSLMNFSVEIIVPPKDQERGVVFCNYTKGTGAINMLDKRIADMSLGSFWFTRARSQVLTASDSYFQSSNVAVLVKNSLNYESPGILWFPYKFKASMVLIASFIIMLGFGYIIEKWSTFMPNKRRRNRCINFIAWTLGLPSITLPVQNSRRIFVMAWILFGLVIRAQYSVVALDYTIILSQFGYNALNDTTIFTDTGLQHKIIDFQGHESPLFVYLEKHSNERLFVISPLEFLLNYVGENRKGGVLTTLKESFMLQNICIYFTKHSFLVDRVNLLIQRINSAGLLNSWAKTQIDWSYLKSSILPKEIVIGQRELSGIYYVWFQWFFNSLRVGGISPVGVADALLLLLSSSTLSTST
ncbi:uncharacterized protein LOC129909676 [Episyrphus balteatus]|uniref:uncharacterized protein LOC129909676 n=1 Tax=Episyrphus balteatus TaxID=286459 RepID=UPI0024865B65|nr:uncharacterized protein LOC129909676 [Episyrphus balteatus]